MLRVRRNLPWKSLEGFFNTPFELQNDLSRAFFGPWSRDSRGVRTWPQFNVWSSDHELTVTAEIPGLDPEQIDVDVNNDLLIVSADVNAEELSEGENYQRRERFSGRFERSVRLPFAVDQEKSEARYVDGVLEIRLTKPEQDKPRKLTVNAG
jgi:HSP20 family protein